MPLRWAREIHFFRRTNLVTPASRLLCGFVTMALNMISTSMQTACAATDPSPADYAAAVKLLGPNLQGLVRNESVMPHWSADSDRFWYRREGQGGEEFTIVTAKGVKSPAFDHEGLAEALSAAS